MSHARSSVRLLGTRPSTFTTELLWLAATWFGDEKGLVILDEQLLDFTLHGLAVILIGKGNEGLGHGLADGLNLGGGTTTADTNADVESFEA